MKILNLINQSFLVKEPNGGFLLRSYERIILNPLERRNITLPYCRDNIDKEILIFEMSNSLIEQGLRYLGSNFNLEESNTSFKLMIYNSNIQESKEIMYSFRYKIDILPQTILGYLFPIRTVDH